MDIHDDLIGEHKMKPGQVGKNLLNKIHLLLTMANGETNTLVTDSIYPFQLKEIPAGMRVDVMLILKSDTDRDDYRRFVAALDSLEAEPPQPTRTPGLGAFDRDWSGVNIERKERKR